jgi:hypothetical protein
MRTLYQPGLRIERRIALTAALLLAAALVAPVGAHGGDEAQAAGPAAWLLVLVYGQLVALPFIGLLLLRQARDAWLRPGRGLEPARGEQS